MTKKLENQDRLNTSQFVSIVANMTKLKQAWVKSILIYYYEGLQRFLDNGDKRVKVHGWGEFYFTHNALTDFKGNNHNFKYSGVAFKSYRTSAQNLIKIRQIDPDWEHHFFKERPERFKRIQHSQYIKSLPNFNVKCWKHADIVRYICNRSHIIVEVVEYVLSAFKQVIFNFFLGDLESRTEKKLVLNVIGSVAWYQSPKKSPNQNGIWKEYLELAPAYLYGKEVKQYIESLSA